MRLRLIIRRNGLPDAHILWNSTGLHNASLHNSTRTIADFLQEVDDVIPLESEDRGMEDYVVEVGGFECVHFSVLNNILKEDDEVVIRPITTNDSRFRRVSGRVQVSADGRRLFDGVAFGRPFVRKALRPPVRIPWSKRARLNYDEESQDQLESPNQPVLQDESFNDEDAEEDSEYSDYSEELSSEEIADLAAESTAYAAEDGILKSSPSRKRKRAGLGIQAIEHETPRITSFGSNSTWHQGPSSVRKGLRESPKSVRFEREELDTPATLLEIDSSGDSDEDTIGSSQNGNIRVSPEANKENVAPGILNRIGIATQTLQAADKSSIPSSDTTSSSESDSSLDDDDSSEIDSTSTSDSFDDSSSSDESATESELESEKISLTKPARPTAIALPATKQAALIGDLVEQPKTTHPGIVAPGEGKRATRKRNARRKLKQQFDRAKSLGLPPSLDVKSQAAVSGESQGNASHEAAGQIDTSDLEQRKAALIQHLNGRSDTPEKIPAASPVRETVASPTLSNDTPVIAQQPTTLEPSTPPEELPSNFDSSNLPEKDESKVTEQDHRSDAKHVPEITLPEIIREQQQTPRRAKLDVGSAKRMLFGSLGLRAPKSRSDADKLREELNEKAKQLPGHIVRSAQAKEKSPIPIPEVEIQNDDSWKDKIDLSAVECCYDDVVYSKPPFPFVQRWDPQQQYQISGKRKRGGDKRRERDNKKYYQESYEIEGYMDSGAYQEMSYENPDEGGEALDQDVEMEQGNSDTYAANDQLLGEMEAETSAAEEVDDLPALPADMATLKTLTQDTALPGCIIAFKQMEMSEHTQWSPVISDYKTAQIEAILENGVLNVLLAARDVPQTEKNYDSTTGQRIFAKFEMPVDEEEEEDDEHRLEIGLQDMIEPKLVQAAENQPSPSYISSTIKTAVDAIQDVLTAGQEIATTVLPSMGQNKVPVELDSVTIEPVFTSIKLEKAENPRQSQHVSATTSMTETTLVMSQESQAPILADKYPSNWRDASIELGSQVPLQRFFSEMPDSLTTDGIVDPASVPIEDDNDTYDTVDGKGLDASVSGLKHDDPSIWADKTENNDNDESTRFYSISDHLNSNLPSSNLGHEVVAEDIVMDADSSSDHGGSIIVRSRLRNSNKPAAAQVLEEVEHSLFVDDEPMELLSADQSRASAESDFEDNTLSQDAVGKDKPSTNNDSAARFEEFNSDTDSSSLPSLKDLLSQPIVRLPKATSTRTRKPKLSTYPKIPSATPEDADAFVFSQAPKRIISHNDKMVADLETGSFLGSSDIEDTNEPYELEARVTDGIVPKIEGDEVQLPPVLASQEMHSTSRNNAASDMVIDLTLSSDPVESNDNSTTQTMSTTNSMPSGPGWIDKPARGAKSKAKTTNKSPRSSLRRKKSVI